MKKTIKHSLLLVLVSVSGFFLPLKAQDATKELAGFTKKFQDTYNAKDAKALKMMYTDDAVRTAADGTVSTGSEAIVAQFKEFFDANKVNLALKQDKVETGADGSTTATGTYHVTGTRESGETIDIKGAYTNSLVKMNGHWKIKKSVLTAM